MSQDNSVNAEIVDDRTGEIIPVPVKVNTEPAVSKAYYTFDTTQVGRLELDEQAETVLNEELDENDVRIRPDGLVYLPWTYYANKLNRAFGRLKWGIIPNGAPAMKPVGEYGDILVVWGFWLIVKGIPISFSIGETTYNSRNRTMSEADACEGAKSSSLARSCKQLGIALQLWDTEWCNAWRSKYAETYKNDKGKTLWRKKTKSSKPAPTTQPQATQQENGEPYTEEPAKQAETPAQNDFTGNEILSKPALVHEISKRSGKTSQQVCVFVSKLEKRKKFSVDQIVNQLKAEE